MRVQDWLGRIFDPPVTQRHFDRAMAEQTDVIRMGNAAVREGNAEILALVAEMKAAVSDLSDDYEARASDAAGSAPVDDDAG